MKQIVIKKWIDGKFCEVKRYSEEEVVSIRHHTDGLEIILKGNIRFYDTQCIIEFEEESEDERIRKEIISYIKSSGAVTNSNWIAWLEKQGKETNKVWKHWKDGIAGNAFNPDGSTTENYRYRHIIERMQDDFIDKATEWLKKNADDYTWYDETEGESGMIDDFIEDFKKYMKGE